MFCDKCGAKVPDNAAFCPNCGNAFQYAQPASGNNLKASRKWIILIPAVLMAITGVLTIKEGVTHYSDSNYAIDVASIFVDDSSTLVGIALYWVVCGIIVFLCLDCIVRLFKSTEKKRALIVRSCILITIGLIIWIAGQALNNQFPDSIFMVTAMWVIYAYYHAAIYVLILSTVCLLMAIAFDFSGFSKNSIPTHSGPPMSGPVSTGSATGSGYPPFGFSSPSQSTIDSGETTEIMSDTEIIDITEPYGRTNQYNGSNYQGQKKKMSSEPSSQTDSGRSKGLNQAVSAGTSLLNRNELVMLTREEAMLGCTKSLTVDGRKMNITIPSNTSETEKIVVRGYGHIDGTTGKRGDLIIQFYIT